MPTIRIDASLGVVKLVRFEGPSSDGEFARYLATLDRWLEEPERYAVLMHSASGHCLPPAQQERQARWMGDRRARIEAMSIGMAFVIDHAPMRFARRRSCSCRARQGRSASAATSSRRRRGWASCSAPRAARCPRG